MVRFHVPLPGRMGLPKGRPILPARACRSSDDRERSEQDRGSFANSSRRCLHRESCEALSSTCPCQAKARPLWSGFCLVWYIESATSSGLQGKPRRSWFVREPCAQKLASSTRRSVVFHAPPTRAWSRTHPSKALIICLPREAPHLDYCIVKHFIVLYAE